MFVRIGRGFPNLSHTSAIPQYKVETRLIASVQESRVIIFPIPPCSSAPPPPYRGLTEGILPS